MAELDGLIFAQYAFTIGGAEPCRTGFHLEAGVTNESLSDTCDALDTLLTLKLRNILTTSDTVDSITCKRVGDPQLAPAPVSEHVKTLGSAGTVTGTRDAPTELGIVIQLKTALAGRRSRGHMFLPPVIAHADISGEGFASGSGYVTVCNAFSTELAKLVAGASGHPSSGVLTNQNLCIFSKAGR